MQDVFSKEALDFFYKYVNNAAPTSFEREG